MQTRVYKVIVGKALNTDTNTLKVGDVALFNQDRMLIKTEEDAINASSVYVGVVDSEFNYTKQDGTIAKQNEIDYSMELKKSGHPTLVVNSNQAPVQQQVAVDFRGVKEAEIIAGHRYVIRIVYKDLDINKYQVTHTYEVIAEEGVDLVTAFIKKINGHKNARVYASNMPYNVVRLYAKPKSDNDGVNSLNEHSMVNMEVSFYKTIPGSLLNNDPIEVPGVKVYTDVEAKPGIGYWKQVRDAEVRNMGYDGHVFTGAYPQIKRKLRVVEGTYYDQVLITTDNPYLSNDNQYIKTTPLTCEVYFGHTTKPEETNFVKFLKAFITGKKADKDQD